MPEIITADAGTGRVVEPGTASRAEDSPRGRSGRMAGVGMSRLAITVVLAAAIAVAQIAVERHRGEAGDFYGRTDEGSHFTTALMIRDYIRAGFPGSPVAFAKAYYAHYPKVAFGSWPPLFHILLAGWMTLAPANRPSAIWYEGALTGAFAALAFAVARRHLSGLPAAAVAAAVWLAPVTQAWTRMVQADMQYALFSALAAYAFADYAVRPSRRGALWFGAACFSAVMTKNNALFLPIGFGIIALVLRRVSIVRRADLWVAALPSVAAVAVWQYLTLPFVRNNMRTLEAGATPAVALMSYARELAGLAWPGAIVLAAAGVWLRIGAKVARREPVEAVDAASLALTIAPVLFHAMLPHDVNQRYLLPALPAVLYFAASAADHALGMFRAPRWRGVLAAAAIGLPAVLLADIAPLPAAGYVQVAKALTEGDLRHEPSVLIVGSFTAEERLIPEIATREDRPWHWLLRGYKILRKKTGVRNWETSVIDTPAAATVAYLQDLPVAYVVLADDGDEEASAQVRYMKATIAAFPRQFTPVLRAPVGENCRETACTIEVFRVEGRRPGGFSPEKLPPDMQLWKGL